MKVGIFTFHCAHNYGAMLQTFALEKTLNKIGCDASVIDYRPLYLTKPYRCKRRKLTSLFARSWKFFKINLYYYIFPYIRYYRFENFLRKIKVEPFSPAVLESLDCAVFGSDQIWNIHITEGDRFWFAEYLPDTVRKISYAASSEIDDVDFSAIADSIIANFDAISVRESNLQRILSEKTNKNISCVLDPTLLADERIWEALDGDKLIKDKYLLLYQVIPDKYALDLARKLATENDWKLIEVASYSLPYDENVIQTASPEMFYNLIRHSEFVVTTSFHGTAFSLICEKPFLTVRRMRGRNCRVENLLNDVGLLNRLVCEGEDLPPFDVDFKKVKIRLEERRQESLSFLRNALML